MDKPAKETPRERALRTKNWLRSTGPTSVDGKARSAMRARKHGLRGAGYKSLIIWVSSISALAEALL